MVQKLDECSRLHELLEAYETGFYLQGEVVSVCLDMLYDSQKTADLWADMPSWVKDSVIQQLKKFSEDEELVTFGQGDPQLVKSRLLVVKHWLSEQGVLNR